jgi:hypothetical protein
MPADAWLPLSVECTPTAAGQDSSSSPPPAASAAAAVVSSATSGSSSSRAGSNRSSAVAPASPLLAVGGSTPGSRLLPLFLRLQQQQQVAMEPLQLSVHGLVDIQYCRFVVTDRATGQVVADFICSVTEGVAR